MEIAIQAEPGELAARAAEILKALAGDLASASPAARAALEALEDAALADSIGKPMREPKLEDLRKRARAIVREELRTFEREAAKLAREDLSKALYIGPRGGKWQDPDHTIPWDGEDEAAEPKKAMIRPHPKLGFHAGDIDADVTEDGDDVLVKHSGGRSIRMPKASLRHFVNDLHGVVDEPPDSGHPEIDAVTSGKAKFLGKGHEGLAFRVGKKVVKVSTTVPFHPDNQGHRTPDEAARQVTGEAMAAQALRALKVPHVPEMTVHRHGEKAFLIRDHVEIPETLSSKQLDQVADAIHAMHRAGWALNDSIQAGVDDDGNAVLYDVGFAAPSSDIQRDSDAHYLEAMFRRAGRQYERPADLDNPGDLGKFKHPEELEAHVAQKKDSIGKFGGAFVAVFRRKVRASFARMRREAKGDADEIALVDDFEKEALAAIDAAEIKPPPAKNLSKALGSDLRARLAALARRTWERVALRVFGRRVLTEAQQEALGRVPKPLEALERAEEAGLEVILADEPVEPLGAEEKLRQAAALERAGDLITGLADRTTDRVADVFDVQDVREAVAGAIERREVPRTLSTALRRASDDLERDWDRVAVTELQAAANEGRVRAIRQKHGEGDPLVFKRPAADACSWCVRLHIGPDGNPRLFRLSSLDQDNRGRRKSEWKAVRGPTHPQCSCPLGYAPPGWGFDDDGDLVPGGRAEPEDDVTKALELEDAHQRAAHVGGVVDFQGLQIRVEANAGDVRRWRCPRTGARGQTTLRYAYGEILGTRGMDGDPIDVYLGPDPRASFVYVVDQLKPDGAIDEQKLFLGFGSPNDAEAAYKAHYPPEFLGALAQLTVEDLRAKLENIAPDGMLKSDAAARALGARAVGDRGWGMRWNGHLEAGEPHKMAQRVPIKLTVQKLEEDKRARRRDRIVVPTVRLTGVGASAKIRASVPSPARADAAKRTEEARHNLERIHELDERRRKNARPDAGQARVGSFLPSVPVDLTSG